jgi:hypothetical protein
MDVAMAAQAIVDVADAFFQALPDQMGPDPRD